MVEPVMNPPDEEFVRRLHEEQSEVNDLGDYVDPHAADLQLHDEPDTAPENT